MLLTEIYDIYNDLNRPIIQVVANGSNGKIYVNFQTDHLKELMEEQTNNIIETVLNKHNVDSYQFHKNLGEFSTFIRVWYHTTRRDTHYVIREELTHEIQKLYLTVKKDNDETLS